MQKRRPPEDGEIAPEEPELEDIEEHAAAKITTLRGKLRAAEDEKKRALEDLQRVKADFLNSRKRLEDQLERDRERITELHIIQLLPLADSFDMALEDPKWQTLDQTWRTGIEAIHAQLQRIFAQSQVSVIGSVGEPFDPNVHEAVSNQPVTEAKQADTVLTVLQKGYRRNGSVIRPAKVVVGVDQS